MKTLGLIPARAGSKGIKNKNLAQLAGKPLLYYTINSALESQIFTDVVVTSNGADILQVAESFGATPLIRPDNLSQDQSPTEPAISHCIKELSQKGHKYDDIVLLQPTSPLRTASHIREAKSIYDDSDCEMLVSVVEPDNHPLKAYKLDNSGDLVGAYGPDFPYRPRQSLPQCFFANGAIYIFSTATFMKNEAFPKEGIKPYIMSASDSIDIDNTSDLARVEEIIRKRDEQH